MSLAPPAGTRPSRMTGTEIRATATLTVIASLRLLGLFLILPVFAVHAQQLPGGSNNNCGVASPVTWFQPINPILTRFGLTLVLG